MISNWQVKQPDLRELLEADDAFISYLSTLKAPRYHEVVAERLESLIQNASYLETVQYFKDNYRRNAAELYRKNLKSLSGV